MNRLNLILFYLKQYKFTYLAGIIAIVLTNLIAVTIPEYLKQCIDLLVEGINQLENNQATIINSLLIMLGLAICGALTRSFSRVFFFNPGRSIEYQIKNDLFQKLTKLQRDYYDKNQTGAIISRIQNDITGIRLLCGFGMMQMFNIATALSLTPYKMWLLSPELTLYCVLPIIIVFILVRIGMHFIVAHTRNRMADLQDLSSFIVSSLSGIDVIKSYNLTIWCKDKFSKINESLLKESLSIAVVRSFLMPILSNLENILKILVLLFGGLAVIESNLTIGELTAFIAYTALLTHPIMGLGWLTTMFQQGMVGLASLETIFQQDIPRSTVPDLPSNNRKNLFNEGLKVRNLSYKYPGQKEDVLHNISFEIEPNQTVGLLGQVGAGKTTLVNCLNRYLNVENAQIFLGSTDINTLSFFDLRSVIRTVSQDTFLFSDTIKNNIKFGLGEGAKKMTDLDRVVYESSLSEEVEKFPEKMDTIVGEKGIMLSGGQKQRISLARSMMRNCDLLILDNVLSAVDYETERFLLSQILKRKRTRSQLIVSHRVQALEKADFILVMEEGRLVDQGTHQELIERPGLYHQTWKLQNQNYGS